MRLRFLVGPALSLALLAACAGQPQANPDRPFQVTPALATPDPAQFGGAPGSAYPSPDAAVTAGAYPNPAAVVEPSAYPGPTAAVTAGDPEGRAQSALQSLPVAQEFAQSEFSPEARLYAVMPSGVMIANLGNVPVVRGWFYKFKTEGSPREFVIQVTDGKVSGSVETEPIDQLPPFERALPLDTVTVDSDQVYERLTQRAPELGVTVTNPKQFDLELIYLEGMERPVWSVYDSGTSRWLLAVDAVTGADVPNPRG